MLSRYNFMKKKEPRAKRISQGALMRDFLSRLGGQRAAELRRAQHLAKLRLEIVRPAARHADRDIFDNTCHGTFATNGHPHEAFVAVASLSIVVELHRHLHNHREEEIILLLRKLDVRAVALHRDLEDAADLVLVFQLPHTVELRDRNPEHQLEVEPDIGDLHVALVVAAVANLFDVPFNRNFSRCHLLVSYNVWLARYNSRQNLLSF